MLISPADLRAMLRADAVELVLGVLLMLTGLLTVALVGVLRQRVALLLWIGAFSLLYGIRLLVRTGTNSNRTASCLDSSITRATQNWNRRWTPATAFSSTPTA
jgi:hypothetical protein